MSITTTSGKRARASATARSPSAACTTRNPERVRYSAYITRLSSRSSTRRTRGVASLANLRHRPR